MLFKKTRLIKRVYGGIQGSIAPSGCVIDMSSDTATMGKYSTGRCSIAILL